MRPVLVFEGLRFNDNGDTLVMSVRDPFLHEIEAGMVDGVELLSVNMDGGPNADVIEYSRDHGDANKGGRTMKEEIDVAFGAAGSCVNPQLRGLPEELEDGERDADQNAGEEVSDDNGKKRCEIHEHGHFAEAGQMLDVLNLDEIEAGKDEHSGEAADWNQPQDAGEKCDDGKDPDAVQDGGEAAGGSGLNVSRAADDDAGHGNGADEAAESVADALGDEFAVEVCLDWFGVRRGHLVHGGGGEECLGTGDECDGQRGADDAVVDMHEAVDSRQGDDVQKAARDLHVVELQVQQLRDGGGGDDAEQGSGNQLHAGRPETLPEGHDCDDQYSEEDGALLYAAVQREEIAEDGRAHGLEVGETGALGLVVHHDMELLEDDEQSDTGEHAVDDSR